MLREMKYRINLILAGYKKNSIISVKNPCVLLCTCSIIVVVEAHAT